MMENRISQTAEALKKRGRAPLALHSPSHDWALSHFPSEVLLGTFRDFVENPEYRPDPKGDIGARKALAAWYRHAFSAGFHPDHFLLTAGTSESYAWILRSLCEIGDHVLVPEPCYPLFQHTAQFARVGLKTYSLDPEEGYDIDLAALERSIDRKTKGIFLVSPHNPTGAVVRHKTMERLEALCSRHGLALILDEVFSSFVWEQEVAGPSFPRPNPAKAPLCITLNGASKALALPWLKVAWMHLDGSDKTRVASLLDDLETTSDTFLPVNTWAQKALPDLLGAAGSVLPAWRRELKERRDHLVSTLKEIPGVRVFNPPAGVMIVLELTGALGNACADEEACVIDLMEQGGVHLHPGYFYDFPTGSPKMILSFQHPENDFEDGLERLSDFLKSRV